MSKLVRVFAALLFTATLTLTQSAIAQAPADEASAHFDRGVSFFKDGDYTAAMVEFRKAYELDANYRVLYNLGQTSRELRDYASALSSFERYLAEGGGKIDADRKKKVDGWVAELRGKVATVTLKTNVQGAEVSIDDVQVGTTPVDKPILVNAGRRKVALIKTGYAPRTQYVDVAGTEAKSLSIDLMPLVAEGGPRTPAAKPDPSQPRTTPPPGPESSGGTARPWVMLGVTVGVGAAAGIVGALSLGKKAAFDEALKAYPTTPTAVDDARSSARTFAIVADALAGVAVAGGLTTILLFAVDRRHHSEASARSASLRLGPTSIGFAAPY